LVGIRLQAQELGQKLALFRRGLRSGGFGFVFGVESLEALEFAGDLANGALEPVDHAADSVEDGGLLFEGIDPAVPHFRFGVEQAVETPGVGGELVDALLLGGGLRAPGV
jgi:hypothetical protein